MSEPTKAKKTASGRRRAAGILLLVLIAGPVYWFGVRPDMSDFGVCFRAGERLLAGETLYRETDGHLQFKYAPAAAFLFAPLSLLPLEAAKAVWFIIMAACLAGILRIVSRWPAGSERAVRWAAVWTAAVMAKNLGREFQLGQVNLLLLLLMVVMVRENAAGRPGGGGLSVGVSLLFKPYAAIFLPDLVLKRKWAMLAGGAAALAAGLILPAAVYGFAGNAAVLAEWKNTLFASTPGLLLTGDNASLWAFAAKAFKAFGFPSTAGPLIIGGLAAAVLGLLYLEMVRRGRAAAIPGSEFAEAAALMMLIPMVSPLGWNYNYLYGLPAVFLLSSALPRFRPVERAVLVADFALIGGTLREVLGKTAFRFYTENALILPCFLLLFAMLYAGRRRRLL
ncbi:MAG TPA: glycosyltransferase family 87 protein [Candidatus Aminicenantes bacterium]|nr:glycosyltransferase family 87 protein [Candidatus Aminicenantes bacterium]